MTAATAGFEAVLLVQKTAEELVDSSAAAGAGVGIAAVAARVVASVGAAEPVPPLTAAVSVAAVASVAAA
jgi:hypothetical protein